MEKDHNKNCKRSWKRNTNSRFLEKLNKNGGCRAGCRQMVCGLCSTGDQKSQMKP